MICKILGLFVNPLAVDGKYSLLNRGRLFHHFQMLLSKKLKIFSQFYFAFYKFRYNFQHFQKKMTLIADVFLNLKIPKNVVREMSKKCRLRGAFDK